MNLADFFTQGLALVGTFNLKIAAFLFLLCLIGEATVLVVPYLFETTWLLAGYQLSQRVLSPLDLALFMLTSMAGRQAGALILYYVSRSGSKLVFRYKEFLTFILRSLFHPVYSQRKMILVFLRKNKTRIVI